MSKKIFETINGKEIYRCKSVNRALNGIVQVPGSKSITNRALLLAILCETDTLINNVLLSDDSRYFLEALKSLGFSININEEEKTVLIKGTCGNIPNKTGRINVGSAGTAARFLTAFLAVSDGEYIIECSEQMKKRPMEPLFNALTGMRAKFEYLEKEGFLPVKVIGNKGRCSDVSIDISNSTQYLSALMMVAPITKTGYKIKITSFKKDGSYIAITRKMMKKFGIRVDYDGENYFIPGNQYINLESYNVEPDMSAACYFYAMAAITGGNIAVRNVFFNTMQGDIKFFGVLEKLGCKIEETFEGIKVHGPVNGEYCGVDVDLNDFSDQSMTLAVLAATAKTKTVIRNVEHIKYQECNRMMAIVHELRKVGVDCEEDGTNIYITPKKLKSATINTYEDHRMAMAFAVLGLKIDNMIIDNPSCCSKTFEDYFQVLENLVQTNLEVL